MVIHTTCPQLPDDEKTLRCCSLTCRAWLHASRTGLFHDVRIRRRYNFRGFSALLQQSPYIGDYVRRFEMELITVPVASILPPADQDALYTILSSIRNVEHLIRCGPFPLEASAWMPRMESGLEADLRRLDFFTSHDFVVLLYSVCNLTKLTIWWLDLPSSVVSIQYSTYPQTFLRTYASWI